MKAVAKFFVAAMFLWAIIVVSFDEACGDCIIPDDTRGWDKPTSEAGGK